MQAAGAAALSRLFEVEGLRREAAVATAAGDHQKAVALLHRVFVLRPEAASSHLDLGLAHLRAGQHAEAIDRLGTAAALDPTPDVHRHLAEAYAAMGMTADSERERAAYERLKREAIRRRSAAR
jgi:tetratricopeptide (TPR) repeat protein